MANIVPNLSDKIVDFVLGNNLKITRTIAGVPAGQTIVKSWFTVKLNKADLDNQAVMQKVLLATDSPGVGQITDTGALGTGAVRIDCVPSDTANLLDTVNYHFSIKHKLANGEVYTSNVGIFRGVTDPTKANT